MRHGQQKLAAEVRVLLHLPCKLTFCKGSCFGSSSQVLMCVVSTVFTVVLNIGVY